MAAIALSGPRVLLRQLREVMAGTDDPQGRLDKVVRLIAANMVAEVCSVYLLRAGNILELFATEGLNPEAVHRTRLSVGEGLVGDVAARARPLNLSDAQAHPSFAYRPETGEEIYHSLLGVPILRGGSVMGVVVVQNQTRRTYTEEEVEALQTVAMVLAELVSNSSLVSPEELQDAAGSTSLPHHFNGRVLADGLADGVAVPHEPRIIVLRTIAEDVEKEKQRLERAVSSMRESIDLMLANMDIGKVVGESVEILEAYKTFAYDRGWLAKLTDAVASGLTAEAAIKRVQDETRSRMQDIRDPYFRERLGELVDLANRLYSNLGDNARPGERSLPQNAIIVAKEMGAAELLDYDHSCIAAVVLEEGAASSHVAIVARALEIPAVGGCDDIVGRIEPGDRVLVDGEHGQVFIRPSDEVSQAFENNLAVRRQRQAKYAAVRDEPAVSLDGVQVALNVNAGLLLDVEHFPHTGADGIGLYRTELQFMVNARLPKVEEQRELYTRVLEGIGDKPVVFRTLDVGGDKILPYMSHKSEQNPALGWRAIRIGLDRPALLRSQLRALLRSASGRGLRLMFPMVADVFELRAARRLLDKEIAVARKLQIAPPSSIEVGVMLEVPALVWRLEELLEEVDFLSIGTNDLLQFFFAADRGNALTAERYDTLNPGFLRQLKRIADICEEKNVAVAVCGEMAGKPVDALALIALGFRNLSMSPDSIGPVKLLIRSLNVTDCARYVAKLLDSTDDSVREQLKIYALDHDIQI